MDALKITRRDFVNGALFGAGAALLQRPAPLFAQASDLTTPGDDWYGYGGVGDYAASHGNTPEVVGQAHAVRDGVYDRALNEGVDTGEVFDVVIVGGGMAGLGAALAFTETARPGQRCLILENHPIFGGESKRNEFIVNGHHLIAPQGANGFSVPGVDEGEHASDDGRFYDRIGIPRSFSYQSLPEKLRHLKFGTDNYGYLYWLDHAANVGYFFNGRAADGAMKMIIDMWQHGLDGAPYSPSERAQLLAWRSGGERPYAGEDFPRWLDSMSYREFIEHVMGLGPHVTRYADPIVAGAVGLGCDAVSAYAAYAILLPGVSNFYAPQERDFSSFERHSFPGGNDGFARHFVKRIIPGAIAGDDTFEAILNGAVNFQALDGPGLPVRMRLGSTVVAVKHDGDGGRADEVLVSYVKDGSLYKLRARAVVMATGGWINRYVVRDLPPRQRMAYASFSHSAFLVANVALTNWRFLYNLGISACRYDGQFGYCFNVRRPMTVGGYQPPLDPDQPTVLSFYVPLYYTGRAVQEQCIRGRTELLTTSYAEYEQHILAQLARLFGDRFKPERDVAGIILNRWGHAYVVPEPGFYFGRGGQPAARDVIRKRFGRIAFGHSELRGNQHWGPAAAEGERAMKQILEVV